MCAPATNQTKPKEIKRNEMRLNLQTRILEPFKIKTRWENNKKKERGSATMSEYVLVAALFNLLTHGIFYLLVRVECYLGRPSVHTGHGALW